MRVLKFLGALVVAAVVIVGTGLANLFGQQENIMNVIRDFFSHL